MKLLILLCCTVILASLGVLIGAMVYNHGATLGRALGATTVVSIVGVSVIYTAALCWGVDE